MNPRPRRRIFHEKPVALRVQCPQYAGRSMGVFPVRIEAFKGMSMKSIIIGLASAALAWNAFAQEIGFVENFALATDRAAALKELVPGTDEYFYYHALHAQNSGQREEFQKIMERWIRDRNGTVVDDARMLRNRQALLDYEKDPASSLAYLSRELNLYFAHAQKTGERAVSFPSRLDPAQISQDTLLARALSIYRNLDDVEDTGLELAAQSPSLSPDQRRHLLARLQRPDLPGLVDMILADMNYRDSRGFGHHEIHRRLTLDQMNELLQKKPVLRNETAFITAYLSKLAPENETNLESDDAAREAYYTRVWNFVKTLDPVHNSLKANVLYHRLRHDQRMGLYDHDRFMEYVKLPREVYYLNDEIRRTLPRGDYMAQLGASFNLITMPPISNEEPLVQAYLLRFFRDAESFDEFRPWIRDDFLKRLFAEAKIVNGIGDPQQWSTLLSPDEYKRLKERVDIDFAPENPRQFGLDQPVKLTAYVKNMRTPLTVNVYEINTFNYYRETGQPLNLAINLDGLVASKSERYEYKETPELRVARSFEFPELKTRGAYVIELIGNGISSRALVQKGRLNILQETSAAGHVFTVLDDSGKRVMDAHAWLARDFPPEKDGRIIVPYSTAPQSETIIIRQGGFATITRFQHRAETYSLKAGIYVDRESLVRGETARVLLRPVLMVNDRPAELSLLEEPKLVIASVDMQGITTEKEIPGLKLNAGAETVCEFQVPENTASLNVSLRARIQNISLNKKQDLSDRASFALNGSDKTAAVQDLFLTRTSAGYFVELRGKNGEPRPGEPLAFYFKHRNFRGETHVPLKTDEQGRVFLGALDGIQRFRVQEPMGLSHTWSPQRDACAYPDALQGCVGETFQVPIVSGAADPLKTVSLFETRAGQFVKDCRGALGAANGFWEVRNLPAGDYSLFLKEDAREIAIRVTAGEKRDGFVVSPKRALEYPRLAPLHVAAVNATPDAIEIRLAHASPFTRVHVFASRYLPDYDVFARMGFSGAPGLLQQPWTPAQTFYESGRDIGDEYRYILDRKMAKKFPGNMLDRPGLLLNPWELRETHAEPELLAGGGEYAGASAGMGGAFGRASGNGHGGGLPTEGYSSFDFLKTGAATLLNLTPGKDGVIRIPRADLKNLPVLRILAVDPISTVLKNVALEDSPMATRELRLVNGLDPAKIYAEQKIITPVQAGGHVEVADILTAKIERFDTLGKAWRLLSTLANNPTFTEFSFVAQWPTLDAKEQRRLYSKYACHELNFFLYHKDPKFFQSVIAPNLKNKKDKTFLDHWLLNEDLPSYLEPWRYGRLNAVEQVLLGRRLREQTATIARDLRDRANLIPPDLEDFNRRFDTAVQTGSLEKEAGGMLAMQQEELKNEIAMLATPAIGGLYAADAMAAPTVVPPPAPSRSSVMKGLAEKRREVSRGKDKLDAAEDKEGPTETWDDGAIGDLRKRSEHRFFQSLDQTKEWAENNYYHLPIEQQLADLVTVNEFWADYAAHDGKTPFLSKSFPLATRNFTEMMLALSVLDLPFEASAPTEKREGARYVLDATSPQMLFHREIREAPQADAGAENVLVAQHFFRADDRYRMENNERFDKIVTDEFLPHVVYGAQVALTNPGGTPKKLQALLQIPRGALPVSGGLATRGVYIELAPFTTRTLEYFFYFPETGTYPHYPVTVARNNQVIARAPAMTFHVVAKLTKVDKTSWAWISQNGTPEEVLTFLGTENIRRVDLEEIAWRMKDRDFFKKTIALLDRRHVYHDTLWSYGIRHDDPETIRTYLRHSPFADQCGLCLTSPLLTLDPVERLDYQHLEYAPLVNPRAHQVGAKRKILNSSFREQYQRFMKCLSEQATLKPADLLAVAYYMTLQDRVEDALGWFARVERGTIAEKLQYDYLDAYLSFYRGDVDRARTLAKDHAGEGVDRWRDRFALILNQLEELEKGTTAAAADRENRDQAQGELAANEPALELQVEAGKIKLDYRNAKTCTLNFYPMDIELLFSRSPFMQEGSAQFSYVQPVTSKELALPAEKDTITMDLPVEFQAKNVMVEALAEGVRKTQAYYANTLRVQMVETYGQLIVTHADSRKPVPGTYVKVYAKMKDGSVAFFKDGYTDLRGRFDYVSVNTNALDNTERFSVLVLSPDFGAVVREAAPPKR